LKSGGFSRVSFSKRGVSKIIYLGLFRSNISGVRNRTRRKLQAVSCPVPQSRCGSSGQLVPRFPDALSDFKS